MVRSKNSRELLDARGHNSGMGKSRFIVTIQINNTAKIWHIVQHKYGGGEDIILLIQDNASSGADNHSIKI